MNGKFRAAYSIIAVKVAGQWPNPASARHVQSSWRTRATNVRQEQRAVKTESMRVKNNGRSLRARLRCAALIGLLSLMPSLMGGCPQFQNDVVDALEVATHDLLLAGDTPDTVFETASISILGAGLELFFGQFRSDEIN